VHLKCIIHLSFRSTQGSALHLIAASIIQCAVLYIQKHLPSSVCFSLLRTHSIGKNKEILQKIHKTGGERPHRHQELEVSESPAKVHHSSSFTLSPLPSHCLPCCQLHREVPDYPSTTTAAMAPSYRNINTDQVEKNI
jgi:hypothetical protein